MKKTYTTLDYHWLTKTTGDPFVDAGGYALEEFSKHFPDLDILQLIKKASEIYVNSWGAKINPFFLNSPITQPAFKGNKKITETETYFQHILSNKLDADNSAPTGECRFTGRNTYLFPCGRNNSVLSGSTAFVNFHHNFQSGLMVSKEIIIRYFFLPLGCEQLQGQIALITSSNPVISSFYCQKICNDNLIAIGKGLSESVLKAKTNSPGTALFRYADAVMRVRRDEFDDKCSTLSLYHFTNFGASPSLMIYELPFQVLKFYSYVTKAKHIEWWNNFVRRYYHTKGSKYDDEKRELVIKNNKEIIPVASSEYQEWSNTIYDSLLNGRSILGYMLQYCKDNDVDYYIIRIYAINILGMKKETIDKIEQMADYIIYSNDEIGIGKAIKKLDGVRNSYDLRRFVLKDIVERYYEDGNEEAIVTVKDYAEYLFPDTDSWRETRDVLIIALYERLHKMHKKLDLDTELTK